MQMTNEILSRLWSGWKEVGTYLGDFQARWLLTVFYFVIAAPFGLIARLVIDPLRLHHSSSVTGWTERQVQDADIMIARQQF